MKAYHRWLRFEFVESEVLIALAVVGWVLAIVGFIATALSHVAAFQ